MTRNQRTTGAFKLCALLTIALLVQAGCSWALAASPSPSPNAPDPASRARPASPMETRPDGAQRLTTPPAGASDQNPAYSPDGARLVFTRFDQGYNDGPASVFLLSLSGGPVSRLTPVEDQDNVNLPGAAWNAVNDRIVFASDRADADDLWRVAPDGSDLSRITTHGDATVYIEPSWSPDGQWIGFEISQPGDSEDGRVGQIWRVRADGGGLAALTSGAYDDRQPNYSPAGDRVLFQRRSLPDGQWDIYTVALDGGALHNVTASPQADETDASWSPNGSCIVYSSDDGTLAVPNLFAVPATGGQPVQVTFSADREDSAPSWSPDGRWIAFESRAGQGASGPSALWRIAVPGNACGVATRVYLPLILNT